MERQRILYGSALAFAAAALFLLGGVVGNLLGAPGQAMVVEALATSAFLGLLALAGAVLTPGTVRERLGLGPGRLSLPRLALLALGGLALSHSLVTLIDQVGVYEESNLARIDEGIAQASESSGPWLPLALLGLALAPGVCEELFFRGFMQRALAQRLGVPAGVILAAALFGIVHAESVHASAAFPMGLYFGTAAALAGSVRAAILCHLVNNTVGVVATAWDLPVGAHELQTVPPLLALSALALWMAARGRTAPPSGPARAPSGAGSAPGAADSGAEAGTQDRTPGP